MPNRGKEAIEPEIAELETAIRRMSYLLTLTRRHDRMKQQSGVPLDRAAMTVLLQLAESGSTRPGELADLLHVEPPHATRQVQLLERSGYAERVPDPGDGRAQQIRLTPAGRRAAGRIRDAGRKNVQMVLGHWSRNDLRVLTDLLVRLVDDFVADAADPSELSAKVG